MPLARVIAHPSEDISPLATRLYAMGYDVEVLAPGEKAEGTADVELEVDSCALDEAMARADAFARANPDSEISVAGGVLPPLPVRRDALSQVMGGISERVRSWRARPQESEQARAELQPVAPAERWAEDRDAARRLQLEREAEAAREAELERQRKWEEAERERHAREAEIARRNQEAEAEVLRMAQRAQPWDEVGEKEPMPWSEAAAVQAEAAVAPELAPAEAEPVVVPEKVAEPPAPVTMPAPPIAAAPVPTRTAPAARRARGPQRLREWRAAAVAAAVVAAVLMLAWAAVSSPRPASPLTNGALMQSNGMEQQVPFGPVTVNATRPARTAVAPKPAPRATKPAPRPKPVAAVRKPAKRAQKSSRAQRGEEPEVVVRHFRTAGPRNTHQQANANVKKISDLD